MSEQQWVRDSLRGLQSKLEGQVSHTTIGRLLRERGYGLHANRKELTGDPHPDREVQFQYLEQQVEHFEQAGWPIISVDSKKKELIGNFKNAGQRWCLTPEQVNEHDFEHDALGKAVMTCNTIRARFLSVNPPILRNSRWMPSQGGGRRLASRSFPMRPAS